MDIQTLLGQIVKLLKFVAGKNQKGFMKALQWLFENHFCTLCFFKFLELYCPLIITEINLFKMFIIMRLSIIVPVYNRPDETDELLASLTRQTDKDFNVVIVEDGSSERCDYIVDKYRELLSIEYYYKPNSGPGTSRNYGAEKCSTDYLVFLDSDCMAPSNYIKEIKYELHKNEVDIFGGPDKAHNSFSTKQKAINYAMTSPLTTGGIRGRNKCLDKFSPRSFNMGVRKEIFDQVKGFSNMRFGEDIDLSYRIVESNYRSKFISSAWVYHKRRTNFKQFFKQVFNSGIARVVLSKKHKGSLKFVHVLPSVFTIGCATILAASFFHLFFLFGFIVFIMLILIDATVRTKSYKVGAMSVIAAFIQLIGYGSGFICGAWKIGLCKQEGYIAFSENFYK